MAVFLVSYDLNKQGQNYTNLINAIKTYDAYIKCLHSQWLISTNDNIDSVYVYLSNKIDNNDLLLITPNCATVLCYAPIRCYFMA